MAKNEIISVLSVGTRHSVMLVGEIPENGAVQRRGTGIGEMSGMRKARIFDLDYVEPGIRTALQQAQDSSRCDIHDVYLLVSHGDVRSEMRELTVDVEDPDGLVSDADVGKLQEMCSRLEPPPGRELLENVDLYYSTDTAPHLTNPVDARGRKLTLHALLVHAPELATEALSDFLESKLDLYGSTDDAIFTGMAGALAGLDETLRKEGALYIDFGAGSTSWCGYVDNHPVCCGAIPIGGDHVTNDVFSAFRPGSSKAAERLKCDHGRAVLSGIDPAARVEVAPEPGRRSQTVSHRALAQVINARMDETLRLIRARLAEDGTLDRLGAGIVIGGGGALLDGLDELVESVFGVRCRRVKLRTGIRLFDEQPELYATAWGGLLAASKKFLKEQASHPYEPWWKRLFAKLFTETPDAPAGTESPKTEERA